MFPVCVSVGLRSSFKRTLPKKIKLRDLSGLKKRGVVVGVGYRGPNPEGKAVNPTRLSMIFSERLKEQ
jgi:hypothetical protein